MKPTLSNLVYVKICKRNIFTKITAAEDFSFEIWQVTINAGQTLEKQNVLTFAFIGVNMKTCFRNPYLH